MADPTGLGPRLNRVRCGHLAVPGTDSFGQLLEMPLAGRQCREDFTAVTEVNYKLGNETLIRVLDGASAKLRSLLKRQGRLETGALRVAVIGGGCSGLQYKMDLVDGPANRDILVESNEVRVVIDPKSALFVTGSQLDFSDDLQQGGFKVTNPNALVTCSCGESFAA